MILNKICYFFYEFALLFALYLLAIAPLQMAATKHYNIDRVIDSSAFIFQPQNVSSTPIGSTFPVYRFHSFRTSEIGWAKVTSIKGKDVTASFFPEDGLPLGRHGKVIETNGLLLRVSLGSQENLHPGDMLCLFKDRQLVGKIRLQDVGQNSSWARILYLYYGVDPKGLTVSEYTVVTQAVISSHILFVLEVVLFLLIVMAHCYFFILRKKPLFTILGEGIRRVHQSLPKEAFSVFINIGLGIPFVWFIINFFPRCFFYLIDKIQALLFSFTHFYFKIDNIYFLFYQNVRILYIISAGFYISVWIWKAKSPILLFWDWAGYRVKEKKFFKGAWADVMTWILHLIIFYAFGNTLVFYLRNDLKAAVDLLWPGISFQNGLTSVPTLLSPRALSVNEVLLVVRYLLWSVTIVGCLFGYLYSIFGYLYGKRIRNLDFTIIGWVTNAICYDYMLGQPVLQMTASVLGLDPVMTQGPSFYFRLAAELLLNLLYTISIWNLGTLFGVMTDKGVRTSGFYSVVRHPSYTLEALMFAMIFLNGLSTYHQWFAMLNMCLFAYYVRSEREDQFMSASNPDYKIYQQKTPYKFIPGVY